MSGGPGKARHRAPSTPSAATSGLARSRSRAQAAKAGGTKTSANPQPGKGPGAGTTPPQAGPNPMMPLMMMLVVLLVITSPGLREGMGLAAGGLLEPTIGMGGELIVMTIWIAGLIMVFSTTLIRHFIMDWAKMAEVQQKMGAFQKEVRKARQSGNMARMNKLMKTHQPKVMTLQAEMSSNQTKPMVFTMFIAMPIFIWLHSYIDDLAWRYASLPWESAWNLNSNAGTLLPHWIVLYSLMSLPFGQALQRGLKLLSFSSELRKLEHGDDMGRFTGKPGRSARQPRSAPEEEDEPEREQEGSKVDDAMEPEASKELPADDHEEGDLGYSTLVEDEYGNGYGDEYGNENEDVEEDEVREAEQFRERIDPVTGEPYTRDP